MISFHHSFSTRIFLDETSSPERDARRAKAKALAALAKEEARTPNELREFWWFLRNGTKGQNLEGPRPCGPQPSRQNRPAETRALPRSGNHA